MSLVALVKRRGPSGFGYGSTAGDVVAGLDLSGKTFLVTGTTSGLGIETARALGGRGARVIAAARSRAAAEDSLAKAGAAGDAVACDLAEPASVRACVEAVKALGRPLDAIVCNAGIMALRTLEVRFGVELQFLTNHVGHFLLVTGLLDALAPNGRVVMVSSAAHHNAPAAGIDFDNLDGARGYRPWAFYGQSKLANLLFAKQLAKRLRESGSARTANALHPGVIATKLTRHMPGVAQLAWAAAAPIFLKTAAQGAATQCYVATSPALAALSGEYFADCNTAQPSRQGRDAALGERLWARTEEIVAKLP